ncbi:protein kinase domain-containing protein [Streptomyces sp. NBC_00236]|uniref:protein kinase domain-containing protein n=1 Tax=Streptomyces sp. NBC_00236 TaxID=2903639 RepID=UPI002E28B06C|nr:protein kinase [Streptomyces sp. NBC_00236]
MPRAEKSLRGHLQDHGRLPLSEAVAVLSDVAEALTDLKDREVVHRDLKPENILLLGGPLVPRRLRDHSLRRSQYRQPHLQVPQQPRLHGPRTLERPAG